MLSALRRAGRALRAPSGLTGAALAVSILPQEPGLGPRIACLFLGWGYGRLVGALVRAFRVAPGAFPLVGLIVAPAPVSFLLFQLSKDEHGAVVLATAILGLLVGTVEWAHERWRARAGADPGE